jgi:hypothetical protein
MNAKLNTKVGPKPSPNRGEARLWIATDSDTSRSLASTLRSVLEGARARFLWWRRSLHAKI